MPVSGGASGKRGDWYELFWAAGQLLETVSYGATHLTLEALDPEESKGVEFSVVNPDCVKEYWSVKRQTTQAGWTLAALTDQDDRGRSILGDLWSHVERDPVNRVVFASSLGAHALEELTAHAADDALFDGRLRRALRGLSSDFERYILPLCGNDRARARRFLARTRVRTMDERSLREVVEFKARSWLYAVDGSQLDAGAVRGHLADLLMDRMHEQLGRDDVLAALCTHGIQPSNWAIERPVRDRIDDIREGYVRPLRSQLIGGSVLPLTGPEGILDDGGKPAKRRALVVAGAGGGKSSTLVGLIDRLSAAAVPVLPIRFDELPDGLASTTELGRRKLRLPESPTVVLSRVSAGQPCVIVVDQLDSVSLVSGRRVEQWAIFEEMLREADRLPNVSIIVGCREFDVDHDRRMRSLKASAAGFHVADLRPLTDEQVDRAVGDGRPIAPSVRPILRVPLHLWMFLGLPPDRRGELRTRDDLFGRFWDEKRTATDLRLHRPSEWSKVVARLGTWLSDRQRLSAPQGVLDELPPQDVSALVSESVLVLADGSYRFFHESFFDYAFARQFVLANRRVTDLLLGGEQHLFRRAQVRQILSYLRAADPPEYLSNLRAILSERRVRFHIKRLVLQWLGALEDPSAKEWAVIGDVVKDDPAMWPHVRAVIVAGPAWFDVLDGVGFFSAALTNGDAQREWEAIWMISFDAVLRTRADAIASLLRRLRRTGEPWTQYLRHVCRTGHIYHSRSLFDLFLSLIDDGTLDQLRPGFAVNDDWWSVLYETAEKCPDLAVEAIAHWLDRKIAGCNADPKCHWDEPTTRHVMACLERLPDSTGGSTQVIAKAGIAASTYVREILPRIAAVVAATAEGDEGDWLSVDPLFGRRSYSGAHFHVHTMLLSTLAESMGSVARDAPAKLDEMTAPYVGRPHDTMAYLLLRAWTAAPATYGDQMADYLTSDSRRLKIGYAYCVGSDSAANLTSRRAVRAVAKHASESRVAALEGAVLGLSNAWEARRPPLRGWQQLQMLEEIGVDRLGQSGLARLAELRAKFPQAQAVAHEEPRRSSMASCLGPPIPPGAQAKMSDENWLRAMEKYAGVHHRQGKDGHLTAGESGLASAIEQRSKAEPTRFCRLADRMSNTLPAAYFDAILRGVAEAAPADESVPALVSMPVLAGLVRRVHAVPGSPCARWVAWLVGRWPDTGWPDDIINLLVEYAVDHPDPIDGPAERPRGDDGPAPERDPHLVGINTVRGAAAEAIAHLVFNRPEAFSRLRFPTHELALDRSAAVRSCAVGILIAVLNVDAAVAIAWFNECVGGHPELLGTPHVARFLWYAGYRNYPAVRNVYGTMLRSADAEVARMAAGQICVTALTEGTAEADAAEIRSGATPLRKAAAEAYAVNAADARLGQQCRGFLKPFFRDADAQVRGVAASAFRSLSELGSAEQADLLTAFVASGPDTTALGPVVHAVEDSPLHLPDIVCRLVEIGVAACRGEAGDITKATSSIAMDVARITVRLYSHTDDEAIRCRCLDAFDAMEEHNFMGLSGELQKLDR